MHKRASQEAVYMLSGFSGREMLSAPRDLFSEIRPDFSSMPPNHASSANRSFFCDLSRPKENSVVITAGASLGKREGKKFAERTTLGFGKISSFSVARNASDNCSILCNGKESHSKWKDDEMSLCSC